MERIRTKIIGVYTSTSETRLHQGKADICYYITYKSDGKKVWEKVGWLSEGCSIKLANDIRAKRLMMIRYGQELPKQRLKAPLFSDMAESYLEWAKDNKMQAGKDDRYRYNPHLKEALGNKRLNEISSFDLERLKSDLIKKGLAPASVKHCLVLVRMIYNKAISWGKFKGDSPTKGIKMPVLNNRRERFLSHEEASLLLNELAKVSKTVHDMAIISLYCGLRAGEIFNLRWQDLDFDNELIRIMDPKNKTNRTAFMTETVKEILKTRMPEKPSDLIFKERETGEKIEAVSKSFQRTVDRLGFNNGVDDSRNRVCFHTLRHTFGSWLAIQGTPILTIKELLGHKSLAMTERYAHLIPDVKRQATVELEQKFNRSLNGTKVIDFRHD